MSEPEPTPLRFGRCRDEPGLWTNQLTLADGRFFGTRVKKIRHGLFRVSIGQEVPGCALLDLRARGEAFSLDAAFTMAGEIVHALIAEGACP